jgi:hypothetical protein
MQDSGGMESHDEALEAGRKSVRLRKEKKETTKVKVNLSTTMKTRAEIVVRRKVCSAGYDTKRSGKTEHCMHMST